MVWEPFLGDECIKGRETGLQSIAMFVACTTLLLLWCLLLL